MNEELNINLLVLCNVQSKTSANQNLKTRDTNVRFKKYSVVLLSVSIFYAQSVAGKTVDNLRGYPLRKT